MDNNKIEVFDSQEMTGPRIGGTTRNSVFMTGGKAPNTGFQRSRIPNTGVISPRVSGVNFFKKMPIGGSLDLSG